MTVGGPLRIGLRVVAVSYVALMVAAPVVLVFARALEPGLSAVWSALSTPAAVHALWLSVLTTAIAVAFNAIFGVVAALTLVRSQLPGRRLLDILIDLPFAVSPVVVGLALLLAYGRDGWIGNWLTAHGVQVIYALPGLVLATIFVSLPFVVREVAPLLEELGSEQEQAALTLGASRWQTFRLVTLPSIRWGVIYGVVLTTARALGEIGAVSIISGLIAGRTVTLPLLVEQRFDNFDSAGAYAAGGLLGVIALGVLGAMTLLRAGGQRA